MNIIVKQSSWKHTDITLLFGDEEVTFTEQTLLPNLLVELGMFNTTSEARRAGRSGEIPSGWTDKFKATKKHRIWIWNPSE